MNAKYLIRRDVDAVEAAALKLRTLNTLIAAIPISNTAVKSPTSSELIAALKASGNSASRRGRMARNAAIRNRNGPKNTTGPPGSFFCCGISDAVRVDDIALANGA